MGLSLPMTPTNNSKSRVLPCTPSSETRQAAWQIKQHGSNEGLATEGLCAEESTEGWMELAQGPSASVPWAYDEAGLKSMACNYSIKTFHGNLLISLSRRATCNLSASSRLHFSCLTRLHLERFPVFLCKSLRKGWGKSRTVNPKDG